jgi:hypothetical protein
MMHPRLMMLLSGLRMHRELTSARDKRDARLAAAATSLRRLVRVSQ